MSSLLMGQSGLSNAEGGETLLAQAGRFGGRMADGAEAFLAAHPFERGNWLAVGFGAGIAVWFALPAWPLWLAFLCGCAGLAGATALFDAEGNRSTLRAALIGAALMMAAGCGLIWTKSELAGTRPLGAAGVYTLTARIVSREEQPAQARARLMLAARLQGMASALPVRINVPARLDDPALKEGAVVQLRARLQPPRPPQVPGGYDFARDAWFRGIGASGSPVGPITVLQPAAADGWLAGWQRRISAHVRQVVPGSAGAIAAAFASGDRGGIAPADEDAMRDAGLTHLLSISGLHVSAVIGLAYLLCQRLLALWPWLALRVRLPMVSAAIGAAVGLFYTLLSGAEVPTVRSWLGALLVLGALALGRSPLSMRLLSMVALGVMLIWPEAVISPGFQMSFGSVLAIIAVAEAGPVRRMLGGADAGWLARLVRGAVLLVLTGVVIDLALMPMALFHFHRAGVYGALANVLAIPLTTFVTMPLIALALALDLVSGVVPGASGLAWWLVGRSLDLLLGLADATAALPGVVARFPAMGPAAYALVIGGELWLALWSGRRRWLGMVPIVAGLAALAVASPPDLLIAGDGKDIGITGEGPALITLQRSKGGYLRDTMLESAGLAGEAVELPKWSAARCNRDFCAIDLRRGGRDHWLLVARNRNRMATADLAAACARADIIVSPRGLPAFCRPRWFMADRSLLARTGGLAVTFTPRHVTTVSATQGNHGWERFLPADDE